MVSIGSEGWRAKGKYDPTAPVNGQFVNWMNSGLKGESLTSCLGRSIHNLAAIASRIYKVFGNLQATAVRVHGIKKKCEQKVPVAEIHIANGWGPRHPSTSCQGLQRCIMYLSPIPCSACK